MCVCVCAQIIYPNVHTGEVFSKLLSSMERSGKRYAVLYASDSYNPIQYPSRMEIDRFLAETTNATTGCGEVCKIKSSLLEGLLVVSVLSISLVYYDVDHGCIGTEWVP